MLNGKARGARSAAIAAAILIVPATAISAFAQTFTSIASFNGTNGSQPSIPLIQGFDGNLYGAAYGGGNINSLCSTTLAAAGCGTVFKITPAGVVTTVYPFCKQSGCTDGFNPTGLTVGTDGNFYGTTASGGSSGKGTAFKITPAGTLTTLHSFDGTDGSGPAGTMAAAAGGAFYGVTVGGGANSWGTVFKITAGGTLTTLLDFDLTNGGSPEGGLVQGTDGNFYGTTYYGGSSGACINGCGTVFKITPAGVLTTLHSFVSSDGEAPFGQLVQGTDGNFYGTTSEGGLSDCSGLDGCGTMFKISSTGTLTTLLSFDSTDGGEPSGVIQATDGNFYGTTGVGGSGSACGDGCGTLYKITSAGTLTTLHDFDRTDGTGPAAAPFQSTNGTLYGTTQSGGANCAPTGCGTVFSLSASLGPFVETLPTSGNVGAAVVILGNNLTGATGVTFNGTAATFTVVSGTEIKTTVPSGATSGKVKVTTPTRTLTSSLSFRVP
jgi:uncharacterized repeat protein (TIGR03803 family)